MQSCYDSASLRASKKRFTSEPLRSTLTPNHNLAIESLPCGQAEGSWGGDLMSTLSDKGGTIMQPSKSTKKITKLETAQIFVPGPAESCSYCSLPGSPQEPLILLHALVGGQNQECYIHPPCLSELAGDAAQAYFQSIAPSRAKTPRTATHGTSRQKVRAS